MTTTPRRAVPADTRTLLLPFALGLAAAMVAVQLVIAGTGGQITAVAGILTALVALGIAIWLLRTRRALARVRFGGAVAHAIAYVTVTTSFTLHAVLRTIALAGADDGFEVASRLLLATPWFGATLVMSALWGIGLLMHLIGAVLGRGWED